MASHIPKITFPVVLFFLLFIAALHYAGHFFPETWLSAMHHIDIVSEYVKTAVELTAITIAVIKRKDIKRCLIRTFRHKEFEGTGEEFPVAEEKVHGVVIPVSRIEQPEWIIHHLKPRHIALLYTDFKQSRNAAFELVEKFSSTTLFNLTKDDIKNGKDMITNAEDPLVTKELTRRAIRHMLALGLKHENIFIDTTGGKVPMSIGAFQAAEEEGVSSIYIVGKDERGLITDPMIREQGKPIFISEKRYENI